MQVTLDAPIRLKPVGQDKLHRSLELTDVPVKQEEDKFSSNEGTVHVVTELIMKRIRQTMSASRNIQADLPLIFMNPTLISDTSLKCETHIPCC